MDAAHAPIEGVPQHIQGKENIKPPPKNISKPIAQQQQIAKAVKQVFSKPAESSNIQLKPTLQLRQKTDDDGPSVLVRVGIAPQPQQGIFRSTSLSPSLQTFEERHTDTPEVSVVHPEESRVEQTPPPMASFPHDTILGMLAPLPPPEDTASVSGNEATEPVLLNPAQVLMENKEAKELWSGILEEWLEHLDISTMTPEKLERLQSLQQIGELEPGELTQRLANIIEDLNTRMDGLTQAEKQLSRSIALTGTKELQLPKMRAELIECRRQLGKIKQSFEKQQRLLRTHRKDFGLL